MIIGLCTALYLVGCSQDVSHTTESTDNKAETTVEPSATDNSITQAEKEKIVNYFKSDKEPTVKDATWKTDSSFSVGVIDDGTNRDGFAEYVCQVLNNDFDIKGKRVFVSVIDIAKLNSEGKWINLGIANCN